MVQLKQFVRGNIVGSGSNHIVVHEGERRFLIELKDFFIIDLKKFSTHMGI